MDNVRSLTILNNQIHFTFIWASENDSCVVKLFITKLNLGFDFFVIEKQPYNKLVPSFRAIKNPDNIKDKDFKSFILGSYAEVVKTQFTNIKDAMYCDDPYILSQSQSLAVKPIKNIEGINARNK